MSAIRGNNQLAGNWGQLWFNGELVYEIESFEAKVSANRETVLIGMDEDSKITSLKGEGSFKIKKVFTRGKKAMLENWKKGLDVRATLTGKIADPDTIGGQTEKININNVWFTELTLMQFEKGQKLEEEYPFGFTPSSASYMEEIQVK